MFKRVIIKLSGEALAGGKENAGYFDDGVIGRLVREIIRLRDAGTQTALVVGGGNIWRGRDGNPDMDRSKTDQMGMLATVMNAVYLAESFRAAGCEAVIMTPVIIGTVTELFEKRRAIGYLESGKVLIFAAGTGLPFFSTDTITAVRGAELEADAVLFAKNVDGVYDSDPRRNENAKKIDSITYDEIIRRKLDVIDTAASSICEQQGLPGVIFKLDEPDGIITAASGDDGAIFRIGTMVNV